MKLWSQLAWLVPHAISVGCLAGSWWWMVRVGTNRSPTDLDLATVGAIALLAALASSIVVAVILFRRGAGRYWPWLLVHLGALALALYLAHRWMSTHVA